MLVSFLFVFLSNLLIEIPISPEPTSNRYEEFYTKKTDYEIFFTNVKIISLIIEKK